MNQAREKPPVSIEVLFPPVEPFAAGSLAVPDGQQLYFERCGRPDGLPVVFLHGGPGSGCHPGQRRFFDPKLWHAVLFDQRGCGRSRPAGGVNANTTDHLVQDLERLREHLGIPAWLVFGGSWGATLALRYATAHPRRVTGLLLRGSFLGTQRELEWFLVGLRRFLPEAWEAFSAGAPASDAGGLLAWYRQRAQDPDPAVSLAAASAWNAYESAVMALAEPGAPAATMPDEAAVARLRVHTHYLAHGCFLPASGALPGAGALAGIPVTLVHGRLDFVCPPENALALARALPEARLRLLEGAGHSQMEPAMARALVQELARFAAERGPAPAAFNREENRP
ncbi:MAG TPA: prolyl aminopeptidase [Burkholderiales bacterium]|nr:prolyl aminopeptidase [Burkholderiales bacterium]